MNVSGMIGLAINAQSFCDSFRICVSADNGLVGEEDTKVICENIESKIKAEMERTKDWPIPAQQSPTKTSESKKDK